jgi:hypothetical protein
MYGLVEAGLQTRLDEGNPATAGLKIRYWSDLVRGMLGATMSAAAP